MEPTEWHWKENMKKNNSYLCCVIIVFFVCKYIKLIFFNFKKLVLHVILFIFLVIFKFFS